MVQDWTVLQKRHKGKWVALRSDERTVIASGKTAQEAWKKALQKGHKNPILTRVPKRVVSYVGFGL